MRKEERWHLRCAALELFHVADRYYRARRGKKTLEEEIRALLEEIKGYLNGKTYREMFLEGKLDGKSEKSCDRENSPLQELPS